MTRSAIAEGDPAPKFRARDQKGVEHDFAEIVGHEAFVLFFYPKDFTPGCTAEACSFRDRYEDFSDAGVRVFGISSDGRERHAEFASSHRLPFPLLSDEEGTIRALWGVPRSLGILPGRVTYLVDATGTVQMVFSSQLSTGQHVTEALDRIRSFPKA